MSAKPPSSNSDYSEGSIRVLKGLEPVKQRPGMYTRTDNPLHVIQEVLDNAADEALAEGYATQVGEAVPMPAAQLGGLLAVQVELPGLRRELAGLPAADVPADPGGLDVGTHVLLTHVAAPPPGGDLLDLGCGWRFGYADSASHYLPPADNRAIAHSAIT